MDKSGTVRKNMTCQLNPCVHILRTLIRGRRCADEGYTTDQTLAVLTQGLFGVSPGSSSAVDKHSLITNDRHRILVSAADGQILCQ